MNSIFFIKHIMFIFQKTSKNKKEGALISRTTQLFRLTRALGGIDVHLSDTIPDPGGQLRRIFGPPIIFVQ